VRGRQRLTEVPDVVGFSASDACEIVQAANLVPYGPRFSSAPTTGVITAQQPDPGADAKEGAPVFLWAMGGSGASAESVLPFAAASSEPV
jgi:beta-lactam-binding protein with PASTA domain